MEQDEQTKLNEPLVKDDIVQQEESKVEIHGWLAFFLFAVGLGSLISIVMSIVACGECTTKIDSIFAFIDVILGAMTLALACYTIYAFCTRKTNAVFLGKMYIIIIFVSNLISLWGGEFNETGLGSLSQVSKSLVWSVIWFLYLTFSDQVEEIIPKATRKISKFDYGVMTAFIVMPILVLGLGIGWGIGEVSNQSEVDAEFVSSIELAHNEYTDGRIVFTKPAGYSCERFDLDDPKISFHDLSFGDVAWVRICGDYDTEITEQNFNTYWTNWKDESLKDVTYRQLLYEKRNVNGNPYFIKSVKYNTDNPITWHYVLLFNKPTGKVCVVSYFEIGEGDNKLNELLASIRF